MKICFQAFPLEKNLKALKDLEDKYGNYPVEEADFIVALGGDGFVLKTLHENIKSLKPVFGMNFGTRGFLMNEYFLDDLEKRLIKAQKIELNPLVMKAISPTGKETKAVAINEISIRREKYQAAKLKIEIDEVLRMDELVCDGVIISTPAGSTGYNYSASGPIIPLGSNVISLTAVSSYSPRHWKGGLLSKNAKIKISNVNASKRPVVAHADHIEAKDAISIEIEMATGLKVPLLFDNTSKIEDRVYDEMFKKN